MPRVGRADPQVPEDKFSAIEMFNALGNALPRAITGIVRPVDGSDGEVQFSPTPESPKWLNIPEGDIVDFIHIGSAVCGTEVYPVVRLYIREPSSGTEAAFLLARDVGSFYSPNPADVQSSYYSDDLCHWEGGRWVCY